MELLEVCLDDWFPRRAASLRQRQALARVTAILCVGLSREADTESAKAVQGRFLAALGSVGMLLSVPVSHAAAHAA